MYENPPPPPQIENDHQHCKTISGRRAVQKQCECVKYEDGNLHLMRHSSGIFSSFQCRMQFRNALHGSSSRFRRVCLFAQSPQEKQLKTTSSEDEQP